MFQNNDYNKINTEKCTQKHLNYLKSAGIPCERVSVPNRKEVYPNLIRVHSRIRTESMIWQIVCSENLAPKWLAINAKKEYANVSLYIGYAPSDNEDFILRGYACPQQLKLYPPNPQGGWKNPTLRTNALTRVSSSYLVDNLNGFVDFVNWCEWCEGN